ncbi:MAG: DUF5050 domain-containing protein [Christensenella sp.]|nr:DUF5050 domain-containing protein [Christensenella sp.]
MKRAISLFVTLILILGMFTQAACKMSAPAQPDKSISEKAETTEQPETQTPEPTVEPTPVTPLYGLTVTQEQITENGNRMNSPTFFMSGDWIFGQSWDENGQSILAKVREGGNDGMALDQGLATYITVADGYLYYNMAESADDYGIYRMRLSGEGKDLVVKSYGEFQIVGDQIYYADTMFAYSDEQQNSGSDTVKSSECHLMRANLDGSNPVEIIAKPTFYFSVFDDGILYQDDNDNSALHVCALDGSADCKIADGFAFNPIYDGEFVYYTKRIELADENVSVWRVKLDGTQVEKISDQQVTDSFLLFEDKIYYTNGEDSDRVYCMDKDGSNIALVTQDAYVGRVQIFSGGLKYTQYAEDYGSTVGNFFCSMDGGRKDEFKPKLS